MKFDTEIVLNALLRAVAERDLGVELYYEINEINRRKLWVRINVF